MGRLQQLCCGEDNGFLSPFLYISDATDCDDLLLLQNRIHYQTQSMFRIMTTVQDSTNSTVRLIPTHNTVAIAIKTVSYRIKR